MTAAAPPHCARFPVVVVTGAGSGIGKAAAEGFARAGHRVAAVGRDAGRLTAIAGPAISPFPFDIADAAACRAGFAAIAAQLGPIDVLVASAAVYPRGHFLDQTAEAFDAVLRINVCGVANCVRETLPTMLGRNRGRIVVLGSQADNAPSPGSLAYSVSKGALHPLVKGLAAEIDRERYPDVLINELNPGATRTAMSSAGHPPEAVFPYIRRLVELPAGGPTGRFFRGDREVRLGETWKGALKRIVLRRG